MRFAFRQLRHLGILAVHQPVHRRQHQQRQHGRGVDAADDLRGLRALHLGARGGGVTQGHVPQPGDGKFVEGGKTVIFCGDIFAVGGLLIKVGG
ncbi:hypothetical protein ACFWXM_29680, partial [Achromobacter xylosoxidans]|uniref:hypothetical protein n=1 Tax=Alcaligenes xylosoxydans xylosoxydans TaxID=85698 RepID=UPI003767350D